MVDSVEMHRAATSGTSLGGALAFLTKLLVNKWHAQMN